ncbi:phosphatase PAP2 family protein [Curvibacter sp. APW13]|uniref:acid phosphatase n=1 Tax=Curvibacter sp. APW13 TaxID=3077236 RepID=UPI0028DDDCC0|nr:phosphatase PAP2 family protein [Curvibacter sp. APW13]MDT8992488.1 phosphatase PAP2 family protein [Curvibacter sp. APW13]
MAFKHILGALAVLCSNALWASPPTDPALLPSPRPGFVPGYLPAGSAVDSLALLPPPATPGSAAHAADVAAHQLALQNKDSARWKLAAMDAELKFPKAADTFACALGVQPSVQTTPHLVMLLRRTLADAGLATYKAKDHYKRARPFMASDPANDAPICTPHDAPGLRKDGSYPSGHSAVGWAWGLVLSEVAPERANALVQRGWAFGQSRVACGVHWQSDVDAGRLVAAAVVAQLHGNSDFNEQLAEARKEVAAVRATQAAPTDDCAKEAQAQGR